MTNDEIETRITRLETQMTALTVLTNCLLPATVPAARPQILRQFGKWCRATEKQLQHPSADPGAAKWQMQLLADTYTSVEGALKLIEEHERKQSKD